MITTSFLQLGHKGPCLQHCGPVPILFLSRKVARALGAATSQYSRTRYHRIQLRKMLCRNSENMESSWRAHVPQTGMDGFASDFDFARSLFGGGLRPAPG